MDIPSPVAVLDQPQDTLFALECPAAGKDALRVVAFQVSEAISTLTTIDLELASFDPDIDLAKLMDTPATLHVRNKYDQPRVFSGVIAHMERGARGAHRTFYRITLMPALHRLRLGSDCRVFQKKSIPDIVKIFLKEHKITDVKWSLKENHAPREYCVQYRETHFEFVERLLAEEGIFYFFKHDEKGKHILHLVDHNESCPVIEHAPALEYNAMPSGAKKGSFVRHFQLNEVLSSTSFKQREYSFKNPPYTQEHTHTQQEDNGSEADYALYDYGGRYKKDEAGKPFTKYRMERARINATTGQGMTNCVHLCAGHRFDLKQHDVKTCNQRYLLLSVNHAGTQPQALEEEAGEGSTTYRATFKVLPARLAYRPPLGRKPLVDGPLIGHVVGPDGEEIYCDEFGRVKVWLPWQHLDKKDEHASCWIRVAQNWAGAKWGHMAIPRIGQEVIVDFLEGDPDQPIVTGRTYHAQNRPPNTLPDFKTRMVLMSDTHKGSGYNEIRFEDEAGQEEVWFHAQKFHNAVIEDNETWHIKNNRHKRVDASQSESIGGSKDLEVAGSHRETITGVNDLHVKSVKRTKVDATDNETVKADKTLLVSGNWTNKVKRNIRIESEAHQHYTAPGTIFVDAGDKLVLRAGSVISLNVGGNFIRIDDSGIKIEGTIVNVNCGAGSPAKGKDVPFIEPSEPEDYQGPHAERYGRSYKK